MICSFSLKKADCMIVFVRLRGRFSKVHGIDDIEPYFLFRKLLLEGIGHEFNQFSSDFVV